MNIHELEGEVLHPTELESIIDNRSEPMRNRLMAGEIVLLRQLLGRAAENLDLSVMVNVDLSKKLRDYIPPQVRQKIQKLVKISKDNIKAFKEVIEQ